MIFDWGRTLHDPETDTLFRGVATLLQKLSPAYDLVLVSLAKSDSPENRRERIAASGIAHHFKLILVGGEEKNELYEKALETLGAAPRDVVVVDDQVLRGVRWGNQRGTRTIWLRNGKFARELPTQETGNPTFTITNITEVASLPL